MEKTMGLQLSVIRLQNHQLSIKHFLFATQKFCALIRSFFIFILICVSPVSAQWTRTNGPEGVAVSFLANIDGTIYTGTEVNGVYISTDDGLTWMARNSGIETYGISSIISFQGYIFAGTFGGGVYRSSDGGITWTAPSTGNTLFITALVANDPYIFAGAGSLGVYRSSDNGVTWEQKLNVFGVGAMCKSGNKIFASSSNYTDYTTDNGETWMNVQPLEGAIIFSYYCMGDTIFAGGQTKIYRSTDNGNNFTTISLDPGFSIVNIYAFASINSTLYAATSYDGVFKSTDFGSNWIPSNEGMGPKDVRALTITNSSTLIAGTHYVGMYRSTDQGAFWNKSMNGFPAGISILSLLESESSIYAGTRDGVFRTDDNGNNWIKLTGTNDTINYCTVWSLCEKNGDIYASTFLQFNTTIYKTTNKGATWKRSGVGLPTNLTFIKGLATSGNNVVAGTDGGIYYSPDDGTNWYQANGPNQFIESMASSGNYVYAAVPSGAGVYRSVDNGVTWTVSLQSTVDYVEVAAIDNYAFAGSFLDGSRYTSNYGSSWFVSTGFPSDASVFALGTVGDGIVLAGTDLSPNWIYVSYNNGGFFSPYSEGLFENASVEAFTVSDTFMFAGTDYNGVWRRFRPGVVNAQTQTDIPQSYYLAQNYPNPFNPSTTIKYSLPERSFVNLKIFNLLGEEVATLVNTEQTIGNYEIEFDASKQSSGIYLYRIQAGDFIKTKKMILLR
jgi:photosystem II stability/assembly factor-like uncharacterized protein